MKRGIVFGLVLCAAGANAAVVDNFSSGAFVKSITAGTFVLTQSGSMSTGERDVQMNVLGNPFNQSLDVSVNGSGMNVVSNGFGVASQVTLQYDVNGDEVGNTGAGKTLTNSGSGSSIGLSGHAVRVNFLGNDLGVTVTGVLRKNGSVIASTVGVKSGGGAGVLDLVLGAGAMAQADSLTLQFQADPSGDFALSSIETVPEPATLAALGLGAAAMLRRRRK